MEKVAKGKNYQDQAHVIIISWHLKLKERMKSHKKKKKNEEAAVRDVEIFGPKEENIKCY